jgi:hypothetical protein
MAVTKSILQNVRQQSVVKLITDGAGGMANISLIELKLTDETFLGVIASNVNIQTVIYSATDSTAGPIVIGRGSNASSLSNVMYLHGSDNFEFTQNSGFHDSTVNQANITVSMPAMSMLYLVLGKSAGYQAPDQQTKF